MKNSLLVFALLLASPALGANELHPAFPLLDAAGLPVMQSGQPLSQVTSCGGCHDTAFIVGSSDHAAAGVFDGEEPDCLVCHSDGGEQRSWDASQFEADGSLQAGVLNIRKPLDRNCASCHGIVSNELDEPLTITAELEHRGMTDRLSLIHISEPTRRNQSSRMPSSA